jgi:hypothetical protein
MEAADFNETLVPVSCLSVSITVKPIMQHHVIINKTRHLLKALPSLLFNQSLKILPVP